MATTAGRAKAHRIDGHQKQRVLLARALYRDPQILFLDEGTAHLDVETERVISASLRQLHMTRISVAHRPDIVSGADRIVRVARTVQSITERSALIESGSTPSPALSSA